MREISLNILDIAQNSVKAEASKVEIGILAENNLLTIYVSDNGKGMSKEFLASVTDPFTTTRTTRKVGMGIPLFKMAAESTGGSFSIESELGKGTTTTATFVIDRNDYDSNVRYRQYRQNASRQRGGNPLQSDNDFAANRFQIDL